MLKIINSIRDLSFSDIIHVYSQSIAENGRLYYPALDLHNQRLEAEQDLYNYLCTFFKISGAYMGIWIENGIYISAVRIEPYKDGMLISALETAPECRGLGYATRLLSAITQVQDNRYYSHVSVDNKSSLIVHKKAGFSVLSDYARYIDGSVDHKSYTLIKHGDL